MSNSTQPPVELEQVAGLAKVRHLTHLDTPDSQDKEAQLVIRPQHSKRRSSRPTTLLLGIGFSLVLVSSCSKEPHPMARLDVPHPDSAAPRMDIAFCLDTTGSMQGLIDEAKARIQEIDSDLRSGHPTPSVRFGLVAYRDRGERYVTKLYGFDPQIDRMTEALDEIDAQGGGDTEEHVVAGLRRAVEDLDWDPQAAVKFLFLVGDAQPHLDYGEESDIEAVLATAANKGIVIGSLVYGDEMSKEGHAFWRHVAGNSRGLTEGVVGDDLGFESTLLLSIHREAAKHGIQYGPQGSTLVDDPLLH